MRAGRSSRGICRAEGGGPTADQASAKGFDDAAHMVNQPRSCADHAVASFDDPLVNARLVPAVLDWVQELRIQSRHARQLARIVAAVLTVTLEDHP